MHLSFEGVLTERDHKSHIPHPFELPAGAARLALAMRFAPHRVAGIDNMLTLSLFDPAGFRGAGHRHGAEHQVAIDASAATPGYLAGPLPPGRWELVIDTHMIMPGSPVSYAIEIDITEGAPTDAASPSTQHPAPSTQHPAPSTQHPAPSTPHPAPRWYRGDLHAHTVHSDAGWDVRELLLAARARGLDFASVTDHNTTAHLAEIAALDDAGLLVIGGMELTTFWGHALSLGTRAWVDWRVRPGRTMPQIAAEVQAAGGLFVIAHPRSPGDPVCTGCDWRYVEMMPGPARLVEVWNGLWDGDSNNESALALYYEWLNQGLRLVATAGTDAHGSAPASVRPGFNVVFAHGLGEAAVLRAVAAGHLYLSSGPALELRASGAGGAAAMMGDVLPAGPAEVELAWSDAPEGAVVRLIADGAPDAEIAAAGAGAQRWQLGAGRARWCLAELRDDRGALLALTNPVFLEQPGQEI